MLDKLTILCECKPAHPMSAAAMASHAIVRADFFEIVHSFKYINLGYESTNTICLVELATSDSKHVVFVSKKVTPRHGQWSLDPTRNKLSICFNARYGTEGFEQLWPIELFRITHDRSSNVASDRAVVAESIGRRCEWHGHDRKGNQILLEHIQSVKSVAAGPWAFTDKL